MNVTRLPTAAVQPPPNPQHMRGPKPRGIVYLPAYRRALARNQIATPQAEPPTSPEQKAECLIEAAYDMLSRAREWVGRPPLPPYPGPEVSA